MDSLKYSHDEIKKFKKALNIIIDDLDLIWKNGPLDKIMVPVKFPINLTKMFGECASEVPWRLELNKEIYRFSNGHYHFILAKRNRIGKLKKLLKITEFDVWLIKEYPNIRQAIIKEIESYQETKKNNLEAVEIIKQLYRKEGQIEFKLPEMNNLHKLEVQEENGQKIGAINFGNMSLKIITSGDIELVNKTEEHPKQKKK